MARQRNRESLFSQEVLDELVSGIQTEEDLTAVMRQLSKGLLERVLEAEMTEHLGHDSGGIVINAEGNTRNGVSKKTVKGELGEVELEVPRDRHSEFEPQLIKKHQRRLAGLDKRILSLYARGLSTTDIQDELKEMYEVEVSSSLISEVTDAVLAEVKTWQSRPLEALYPVVYLDCIYVKLRVEGSVRTQAVYVAIAINLDGVKEVLGLWIGTDATEGSRFWLSVLTELQHRGLEDVFIFCVDGLKGFPEAIEQLYPQSQVQLCIVHLIRNSLHFVPWDQRKEVAKDLKAIYTAASENLAIEALEAFENKYQDSYPTVAQIWRRNWLNIIPIFDYPAEIRKAIYTTNVIESLNYSLKKPLKTRGAFPTEDSLMKVLFLAIQNVSKKWSMPIKNWKKALNWFAQLFGDRLLNRLDTRN
jgi:putative transposase